MSKTVLFQTIQFSISKQFKCKYTAYLSKTFLFQAIQFSQTVLFQTIQFIISMQLVLLVNLSMQLVLLVNLSGATIPGQSGPESDGNEGVLRIPQSSSITGTSPLDGLVLYLGHSLGGGGLTPLQRYSQCILQSQPTGQTFFI